MRLKSAFICAVLAVSLSVTAYASGFAGDFTAVAGVELSGGREYKAVRLTPEIYASTWENLADIMLYSGGVAVPYFINNTQLVSDEVNTVYEMEMSDSFVKDGYRYYDYELKVLREKGVIASSFLEKDIVATSLKLDTADEFVRHVELSGSYDGLVWNRVADERLYNVDGNSRLTVSFYSEQKYTHYRLKLPLAPEELTFRSVWLEYNAETVTRIDFINKINPVFTVREEDKTTVVSVSGVKHLPVTSVEIDTSDMFKREVSVAGSRQILYNLRFGEEEYKKLDIPLPIYKSGSDTLEVRINNGDDAPVKISSVTVSYLSDELIFKDPGNNEISLYFGNEQMTSPLRYDIGSYRDLIVAQGYDVLHIGQTERLDTEPDKTEEFDYTLIFNITIVIVAVALAFLIVSRLHKVKP